MCGWGKPRLREELTGWTRAADGTVTIVDYKTGKARPQEDAVIACSFRFIRSLRVKSGDTAWATWCSIILTAMCSGLQEEATFSWSRRGNGVRGVGATY